MGVYYINYPITGQFLLKSVDLMCQSEVFQRSPLSEDSDGDQSGGEKYKEKITRGFFKA